MSQDYIALNWVKGEIEETLLQAQQSLEDYVENTADKTRLKFCLSYLHQIHGTLKMVEFYGAALLAEEMEALTKALVNEKITPELPALEILMQAILQLPHYLEHIKVGRRDLPVVLLPILNELRAARGETFLSETALFSPYIVANPAISRAQANTVSTAEFNQWARKVQQMLQAATAQLLQNKQPEVAKQYLSRVFSRLHKTLGDTPQGIVWLPALAFSQWLEKQEHLPNSARQLLIELDSSLQDVIDNGVKAVNTRAPVELIKNLLFYVARTEVDSEAIKAVHARFKLDQALPSEIDIEEERNTLAGPDKSTIGSVLGVLNEEIASIKDRLDLIIRADGDRLPALNSLTDSLKQISDTMGMLGLGMPRRVMQEQQDLVVGMLNNGQADDNTLLDIAGALLYVEASLTGMRSEGNFNVQAGSSATTDAQRAVIREARNVLENVKDAIIAYIANHWSIREIADVPELLHSIEGSLAMIPLPEVAKILDQAANFVQQHLITSAMQPQWSVMDSFADVLSSIEYFLERYSDSPIHASSDLLDRARSTIQQLTLISNTGQTIEQEEPVAVEIDPLTARYDDVTGIEEAESKLKQNQEHAQTALDAASDDSIEAELSIELPEVVEAELPTDVELPIETIEVVEADLPQEPKQTKGTTAIAKDEDDLIDEEIIEIFLEEAEEVTETINEFWPQYKANQNDDEAFTTVRRAFHTLKGSGRMVKAAVLGELAWSIENLFNRVLDKSIGISSNILELADHVIAQLPLLIEDFREQREPSIQTQPLMDYAFALSTNESVDDFSTIASTASAASSISDSEEISIELPTAIVTETTEDELDGELIDIFIFETKSHLAEILIFIEESKNVSYNNPLTDQLQRALHTLKGSAYMAGITSIANIAHPLEKLVKELRSYQISNNEKIVSFLARGYDFINEAITDQESLMAATLPAADSWQSELETLHDELITQAHKDGQSGQGPNLEAISQFMMQGMDSLLDAERLLEQWQQQQDHAILKAICHDLDDVARGAAIAELSHIQLLANKLNDFYQRVEQANLNDKSSVIALANDAHEALLNMFDSLAAGQETSLPDTLLESLRNWQSEETDEADDSLFNMLDSSANGQETLLSDALIDSEDEASAQEESITIEDIPLLTVEEEPTSEEEITVTDDFSFAESSDNTTNDFLVTSEEDGELLEIFLEEAQEIMEAIDIDLQAWQENPNDLLQVAKLQRELHTLKGGALMSDLNAIADLCHELETLYEYISGGRLGIEPSLFAVFERAHDTLTSQLDKVRAGLAPTAATELVKELNRLTQPAPSGQAVEEQEQSESPVLGSQEAVTVIPESEEFSTEFEAETIDTSKIETLDESDREILEIFIEEAAELHEGLDAAIQEWQKDPAQNAAPEEAQRILHTLKGGARLAGLSEIGDIAHDFENKILRAQQGHTKTNDAFFKLAYQQQDILHAKVEEISKILAGGELVTLSEPKLTFATEKENEARLEIEPEVTISTDSTELTSETEKADDAPLIESDKNVVPLRSGTKVQTKPEPRPSTERQKAPQELVRVSADLLDSLVNLAGETSIGRGRMEQQVTDFSFTLEEMDDTLERLRDQLRRLDLETEAQVLFRQEKQGPSYEDFDPLEMDRYSTIQQLSRALVESASDLLDLKDTLTNKTRDTETLLLQQSRVNSELQEGLMQTRMVPFQRLVPRLRRIVRQVGLELGKQVELNVRNAEGEMDRSILERLISPLEHMVRNAVDHGIESPDKRKTTNKEDVGQVTLTISRDGGDVLITLEDDGQGINIEAVKRKAIERGLLPNSGTLPDSEILQFILQAGFSTAEKVTQISGRGVGMDVVANEIKQMGGSIQIDSKMGQGSTFIIRLPFTVSVNRALMIRMSDDLYAVPLNNIQGIVRVSATQMRAIYEQPANERFYHYAGTDYHVGYLGSFLDRKVSPNLEGHQSALPMLLVRGPIPFALQVDSLLSSREIVVKTLGLQFAGVVGVSGGTILGDGSVVIILDLPAMIRAHDTANYQQSLEQDMQEAERRKVLEKRLPRILVVDDSVTVRKVTTRLLERYGMEVLTAKDGVDALAVLQDIMPDLMLLDIEMPRMDGFEVASQVRHDSRLKGLPIIMITSRTGDKHRDRAMAIGVNEYLGKPFQEDLLLSTIGNLLGREVY